MITAQELTSLNPVELITDNKAFQKLKAFFICWLQIIF